MKSFLINLCLALFILYGFWMLATSLSVGYEQRIKAAELSGIKLASYNFY